MKVCICAVELLKVRQQKSYMKKESRKNVGLKKFMAKFLTAKTFMLILKWSDIKTFTGKTDVKTFNGNNLIDHRHVFRLMT